MANSKTVHIVIINGQPMKEVYTSLVKACEVAGISYGKVRFSVESSRAWCGMVKESNVLIIQADIVKQAKGRKNPFPKE